jgi:endogenous inhibitor of DNA gyrase (YacG/DUF329 family)
VTEANEQREPKRSCPRCGEPVVDVLPRLPGRPRQWCSTKCRRAALEERLAAAAGAIATQYVQVNLSLGDHVQAVLVSLAACRRVLRDLRDLRERCDAEELGDARWSPVADELQRTRPQPRPTVRRGAR